MMHALPPLPLIAAMAIAAYYYADTITMPH